MLYVNEKIKNTVRVPQPEGRGAYIRLDQNENPDGVPKWLFDSVMEKVTPEFLAIYPEETVPTEKYAKMIGMNVRNLKYENDFSYKIENTLNAINENTGIVVLVNPNMPVGNVYSREEIVSIINKARQYNAAVIIDEAYYYFYDKTSIDLIKEYDNVFVLRTFSKMLSIPSLRLGVIMSSPENIKNINNYKPHYTVNSIALLFAEAIVDNHDRLLSELKEQYLEGKEYIMKALNDNGYETIPSEGCYVCIKPKYKTSRELTDLLQGNGILILCGKGGLTGWLRLTIAHKKYMELFMNTLLKIDKE